MIIRRYCSAGVGLERSSLVRCKASLTLRRFWINTVSRNPGGLDILPSRVLGDQVASFPLARLETGCWNIFVAGPGHCTGYPNAGCDQEQKRQKPIYSDHLRSDQDSVLL